ncbi:MAG: transcriptional antiterminator, Rof [Gammaproteobacteria bacterium]|nr:transcriptional antiterminator, Rof [Gammaproteobacteria bacterium]
MTDYVPIPCDLYSRYELAILHGERLCISWRSGDGVVRVETLWPRDLQTRCGVEYLIAETCIHGLRELRLDGIITAQFQEAIPGI